MPVVATIRRQALSRPRLAEETQRELQRAVLAQRPGMLAAVDIAELDELRRRLGSKAEDVLAAQFERLFAADADILEQHSARADSGFFILMPETTVAAGQERLRKLSLRIAGAVIDIAGERVRVTPIIGYATFAGAHSADELREQATMASLTAHQHLGPPARALLTATGKHRFTAIGDAGPAAGIGRPASLTHADRIHVSAIV